MEKNKHIAAFVRMINAELPGSSVEVDEPSIPTGDWFIDVEQGGQTFCAVYRPKRGFGLSSTPTEGYGEGPDEVFGFDAKALVERIRQLIAAKHRTEPQRVRVLQGLREAVKVTQTELAERLGVKQPSVSKMERREDASLASMRRYIEALGGELHVLARFETREGELEIEISSNDSDVPPATRESA